MVPSGHLEVVEGQMEVEEEGLDHEQEGPEPWDPFWSGNGMSSWISWA